MSVYVDDLFKPPKSPHGKVSEWCHMWADTEEELHQMAAKIGLRRAWFQQRQGFPHYDLSPAKREQALRNGAIYRTLREFIMRRMTQESHDDR